jgi:hypothetical protein
VGDTGTSTPAAAGVRAASTATVRDTALAGATAAATTTTAAATARNAATIAAIAAAVEAAVASVVTSRGTATTGRPGPVGASGSVLVRDRAVSAASPGAAHAFAYGTAGEPDTGTFIPDMQSLFKNALKLKAETTSRKFAAEMGARKFAAEKSTDKPAKEISALVLPKTDDDRHS